MFFHIALGNHNGNILYAQSKVRTIALRLCEKYSTINGQQSITSVSHLLPETPKPKLCGTATNPHCMKLRPEGCFFIFKFFLKKREVFGVFATGWLGFLSVHLIHHIPNTYMLGKLVILNWQYAWMVFCPACTLHVTLWQLGQAPIWLWPWIG